MSIASPISDAVGVYSSPLPTFLPRAVAALTQGEPEGNPSGIASDLDEAGHGAYAVMKNSGMGTLRDHASHQINLATNHHLAASLAFEPLVKGSSGMAGLVASSVCVAPLAGLAMHAGWHEWREAPEKAVQFAESVKILEAERAFVHRLKRKNYSALSFEISAFDAAAAARLANNAKSAKAARFGGYIGKYSFLSGAAIMGRIGFELIRNIGCALEGNSPDAHDAAKNGKVNSSFLLGTGLASNAFGCLAAAFAFMLGLNFVRKSHAFSEKWAADAPHIAGKERFLSHAHSAYGQFLQAKTADRARFANNFYGKNRLFMLGAGLYAAGTILPSCVKMLAAIGVLNSKQVSADLILGLFATAIAGALAMGFFSHQFFFGHPKLERYEEYSFKEPKELDRRFLTNIDEFAFRDDKGHVLSAEFAVKKGLEMREAAFTSMQRCETVRNALMSDIARSTNHTYMAKTHVGDTGHQPLSFRARIKARFDKNRLKTKHIEAWLHEPENRKRAVKGYQQILQAKLAFLEAKTALHRRMHDQVLQGVGKPNDARSIEEYQDRKAFAERAFGSYDDASKLLELHQQLATKLDLAIADGTFAQTMNELLELHIIEDDDDAKKEKATSIEHRVATHLFEYMPARLSHNRGILLEIEAQAGKQIPAGHDFSRPYLR